MEHTGEMLKEQKPEIKKIETTISDVYKELKQTKDVFKDLKSLYVEQIEHKIETIDTNKLRHSLTNALKIIELIEKAKDMIDIITHVKANKLTLALKQKAFKFNLDFILQEKDNILDDIITIRGKVTKQQYTEIINIPETPTVFRVGEECCPECKFVDPDPEFPFHECRECKTFWIERSNTE